MSGSKKFSKPLLQTNHITSYFRHREEASTGTARRRQPEPGAAEAEVEMTVETVVVAVAAAAAAVVAARFRGLTRGAAGRGWAGTEGMHQTFIHCTMNLSLAGKCSIVMSI